MRGACSGGVNAKTRRTLKKFFLWGGGVSVSGTEAGKHTVNGKRSTPEEGTDITAGSLPDLPDGENDPHRREPLFVPYVASGGVAYWYFLVEDVPCRSEIVHERVEVSQGRAACVRSLGGWGGGGGGGGGGGSREERIGFVFVVLHTETAASERVGG